MHGRDLQIGNAHFERAVIYLCALAILLTCQWQNGAYHSDLGGDPDEAAHAVTSLMVRDYWIHGLPKNPLAFARQYYEQFPKVALGHYPPGYYFVGGMALSLWRDFRILLVLQAAIGAALAVLMLDYGRSWVGRFPSLAAAVLVLVLPITQKVSSCIMSDLLLGVLCLAATGAWVGFIRNPGASHALLFGLLAAAAILTKGSGFLLAAVPLLTLCLTGHLRLVRHAPFWIATVPILLFAAPWTVYGLQFTREGMVDRGVGEFFVEAWKFYGPASLGALGPVVAIFVPLGWLRVLFRVSRKQWLPPEEAGMWSLLLANYLMILLVPAGITARYLLPSVAPALLVALHEAVWLAAQPFRWVPDSTLQSSVVPRIIVMTGMALLTIAWSFHWCPKNVSGFGMAVRAVLDEQAATSSSGNCLVSSDARGEGAVVAAAAFAKVSWSGDYPHMLRASKELASSDWMGRGYKIHYANDGEMLQILRDRRVKWVLWDSSVAPSREQPHHREIHRALASAPAEWLLAKTVPVRRGSAEIGEMRIFRRKSLILGAAHGP